MNFKLTMVTLIAIGLLALGIPLGWSPTDSQARAQQQEPLKNKPSAAPTPTPEVANPLALTPEEIKVGIPLWNELQGHQREYTLAIDNLRRAAKQPNNKDAHSQAALALNAALENSDGAMGRWNEWLNKAATDHNCKDCQLNLEQKTFIRFPTAANTAPPTTPATKKP